MGPIVPELFGGSADLTGSNLTNWSGSVVVNADNADGNYISWGVREFWNGRYDEWYGFFTEVLKVYGATFSYVYGIYA